MAVRERYVSIFHLNLCFYFNCILEPNLEIDPSILRKIRIKFWKKHIFH